MAEGRLKNNSTAQNHCARASDCFSLLNALCKIVIVARHCMDARIHCCNDAQEKNAGETLR